MKRLALVAAVLAVAACGKKDENAMADSTAMMTPAPAPAVATDTMMKPMDSAAHMDSAKKMIDTAKKMMDSAKKAM